MLEIAPVRSSDDLVEARTLFREYADSLGVALSFQDFEREYAELPGEYVPPRGELLLARWDGAVAGCVALRPLESGICEMKRLYLRDAYRGRGIGRALADAIVSVARARRYASMRLDSLPSMESAIGLYRAMGFREIPPYRTNPIAGTRFMELPL
jgi:ribosomal protein S18 acetylase RimI-like enzyme